MAALDFPAAPVNGQVFTGVGGVNWVWDGAKWNPGTSLSAGQFLPLAGGTMVGPIVLPGPPTQSLQAATKGYVDNAIANSAVVVSDTAPTLTNGFLWFNSADTQLYIGYNDGSSSQWVVTNNLGVSDGPFLPLAGGTLTGALTIAPTSGDPNFKLQKSASTGQNVISGHTGASPRWSITLGTNEAESTGNVGSNFNIGRWSDAGAFIDLPLQINRATGAVIINSSVFPSLGGISLSTVPIAAGIIASSISNFQTNASISVVAQTGVNTGFNIYYSAANSRWEYMSSGTALVDVINSAGWQWHVAASGTAGASVPLSQRMSLNINGSLAITSPTTGSLDASYICQSGQAGAHQYGMVSRASGAEWWLYDYTAPAARIIISSAGACSASSTWGVISDDRLKENITPFPYGLAQILPLEPINYTWTGEGGMPRDGQVHYGLSAQQVGAQMPELIREQEFVPQEGQTGEPMTLQTYSPTDLTFALINAVKELAARVQTLEGAP